MITEWLNAKGARTARGRLLGKDAVREMLCNAAYAGHVSKVTPESGVTKAGATGVEPATRFHK